MASEPGATRISEIVLAADPDPWRAAGFVVDEGRVTVGEATLVLAGEPVGRRIQLWRVRGLASTDLDGLPTEHGTDAPAPAPAPAHPNGVERVDHVVAFTPGLERTVAVLQAAGLDLRRVREGPTPAGAQRQAFFRLGDSILEVVEHPPGTPAAADSDAPAGFYGLAFGVQGLEAASQLLGPLLGEPREAVQPGRRIATVRREAGLGLPVALITV